MGESGEEFFSIPPFPHFPPISHSPHPSFPPFSPIVSPCSYFPFFLRNVVGHLFAIHVKDFWALYAAPTPISS